MCSLSVGLALSGCVKEQPGQGTDNDKMKISLTTSSPETRTYIDDDGSETNPFVTYWSEDATEKIGVFVVDPATPTNNAEFMGIVDGGLNTATFNGTISNPGGSEAVPLYAYYPYQAGAQGTAGALVINIPNEQVASPLGFDPAANIMVSDKLDIVPSTFTGSGNIRFLHKNAFIKVKAGTITEGLGVSADEKVVSVTVTNLDGKITGDYTADLTNPKLPLSEGVGTRYNSVKLSIPEAQRTTLADFTGWLCIATTEINPAPDGKGLQIVIETETNVIRKTFVPKRKPLSPKARSIPSP